MLESAVGAIGSDRAFFVVGGTAHYYKRLADHFPNPHPNNTSTSRLVAFAR